MFFFPHSICFYEEKQQKYKNMLISMNILKLSDVQHNSRASGDWARSVFFSTPSNSIQLNFVIYGIVHKIPANKKESNAQHQQIGALMEILRNLVQSKCTTIHKFNSIRSI